jgi:hypothetical protein
MGGAKPMNDGTARRMWQLYEPIHDVTYFTPEARAAADSLGVRGFWMGYFALRVAPLGPVGPAVAAAAFFGFHPDRVARALPDAWTYTNPHDAVRVRLAGADAALRRLWGNVTVESQEVVDAADLAWQAASAADTAGRILAAANQALPRPAQPHLALWQATTTLREHRGDGHIAVLLARGVSPVQAHLNRVGGGDLAGGADAVEIGHLDIQHQHVRAQGDRRADRIAAGGRGGNHVDARNGAEQRRQAIADDGMVVGERDPDRVSSGTGHNGSLASTRPPRACGPASKVPRSSAARSRIEVIPTPGRHCGVGGPSSVTAISKAPFTTIRSSTCDAPACRTALVSASTAIR